MVKVISHGCVVDRVRGLSRRHPPTDGMDGGTEARDIAYVNWHKGPSRQVKVSLRNDDGH